jgi:hypothetical protein
LVTLSSSPSTAPAAVVSDRHRLQLGPIATPDRLLLGPGPSNAHPTVLQALARNPIGHLDPLYIELMSEVQDLLRYAWQTENRLTIPMSGTGSAAMEATLANTVEPGDKVLVAVKGYFGLRLVDMERPAPLAVDAIVTTHECDDVALARPVAVIEAVLFVRYKRAASAAPPPKRWTSTAPKLTPRRWPESRPKPRPVTPRRCP